MGVVSNTTVLSNFAAIGELSLLRELFPTLFVSLEVVRELEAGVDEGYSFCRDALDALSPPAGSGWLQAVSLADAELATCRSLPPFLHAGESSCLAMAHNRGWLFLTDDRAARREAALRDVAVSGSLGCLVLGVQRGRWKSTDANSCLQRMRAAGYYSPVTDVEELLE